MANKSQKALDSDILSRITKRVSDWFVWYSENNQIYRELTKFVYLDDHQWGAKEKTQYKKDNRPRMTFNMLPRYITNLSAEFASNVPDVEVRSEHFQEVDQQIIDITTNLLRNISFDSRNDVVYMTAAQNAWTGGYGAYRIVVQRERPGSFNQVIRYKSIYDPTTCFWDPLSREIDKSDGQYCGIALPMSKSEFKIKYPGVEIPTGNFTETFETFQWITDDQVTVVDYWEKIPVTKKFSLLSDGESVPADEAEGIVRLKNKQVNLIKAQNPLTPIEKVTIVKTESHMDHKIMFYRAIQDKILERSEWDGKVLPIIFMAGILKWVQGKERTYGLIHWMRDAQRAYNYARSEYIYRLQLTRYEKFLVTKENVAGYEENWKNAYRAKSALVYNRGVDGEVPQVISPPPIGADLQLEMNRSLQDLQQIPGRFDPNLGAQGNEVSGIAIATRQGAGNLNIKEFFDNASKAIESGARAVLNLIPKVYDSQRNVTLLGKNGQQETVEINSTKQNRLEDLFFTVKVTMGSSFAIQQSENVEKLITLVQSNPQLANLVSDLIVKNLDLQHGPQLVERIQRWNIPQIAATEGSKDPIVVNNARQSAQNPMQQMAQQMAMEGAQVELAAKKQKLQTDQQKAQDDATRASASQMQGIASLMNAHTNQGEAQIKGVLESRKTQAEEDKARLEEQKAALGVLKEMIQQQERVM